MSKSGLVGKTFGQLTSLGGVNFNTLSNPISNITSTSYTLSSLDSGKILYLKNTQGTTVILPPVQAGQGLSFDLITCFSSTQGNGVTIQKATSDSACIHGILTEQGTSGNIVSSNVAKSTIAVGTSGCLGDQFIFNGDGNNWIVRGFSQGSGISFT